jgi:short-subunit dehydrogenase
VGSINGQIAFPMFSAYSATKFAIEGLSKSIAYELEPFGIKVILMEPGPIRSNFMKGSLLPKRALDPKSPYSELVQKFYDKTNSQHDDAVKERYVIALYTVKHCGYFYADTGFFSLLNLLSFRKSQM